MPDCCRIFFKTLIRKVFTVFRRIAQPGPRGSLIHTCGTIGSLPSSTLDKEDFIALTRPKLTAAVDWQTYTNVQKMLETKH
jgi:hypothetical protein